MFSLPALYQSREDKPQRGWCSPSAKKVGKKPSRGRRAPGDPDFSLLPSMQLRLCLWECCDQNSQAAADEHMEVNSAFCSINLLLHLCDTIEEERQQDARGRRARHMRQAVWHYQGSHTMTELPLGPGLPEIWRLVSFAIADWSFPQH